MPTRVVLLAAIAACGESGDSVRDAAMADSAIAEGCDPTKPFSAPTKIAGVNTPISELDAWMSVDGRILFFVRQDGTQPTHVHRAVRASTSSSFAPAAVVASLDLASGFVFRPVLSGDMLEVVESGSGRLYRSSRGSATDSLSPPVEIVALSQMFVLSPWLSDDGLTLTFVYDNEIVESRRGTRTEEFSGMVTLVEGVNSTDREGFPVISGDGLEIFFARAPMNQPFVDVWHATRAAPTDPFANASVVAELTAAGKTYPVWVSPDRCELVLASTRPPLTGTVENFDLWTARRPR